jgi:SAM-dependent methyltransferase
MTSIERYRNKHGEIWVNVASSTYLLPNFVNFDNHIFLRALSIYPFIRRLVPLKYRGTFDRYLQAESSALLVRHDCRKRLPLPTNSVDHLLCSHFLEHVFPDEMRIILLDFYRALKPGGTIHIIVPDLKQLVDLYIEQTGDENSRAADNFIKETLLSRETRGSLIYRSLEFLGGYGLQHHWMYDKPSLVDKMADAGFEILHGPNNTPSHQYRANDGSVHLVGIKPMGNAVAPPPIE